MLWLGTSGWVSRRARRYALLSLGLAHWFGRLRWRRPRASLWRQHAELRDALDVERQRADGLAEELDRVKADFDRTLTRVNDLFWTVEVMPDGELRLDFISADASGVVGGDAREGIDAAAARKSLAHPDDAHINAAFTDAIRAGREAEVEERLVGFDGVIRWTWSRGTPRREGERLFFDGVTTNITERHELDEQREALLKKEREQVAMLEELHHSRDDFIALAGHELRTPLTVIQGYAEQLLDEEEMGEEQRQQLAIVVRRAGLMSDLVDDLFDLAKLDSSVEPIEFAPVRIDDLVQESVNFHQSYARETGIALRVTTEPAIVLGEHKRLHRMVDNVLDNAVRYSQSDTEVDVTVARDGNDAIIRVTDQGIGIPPDELPHVFERLFRASNAIDHLIPGTGLGLSSTLAIAEGHGGTVRADNTDEGGAVLTIRLPATQ